MSPRPDEEPKQGPPDAEFGTVTCSHLVVKNPANKKHRIDAIVDGASASIWVSKDNAAAVGIVSDSKGRAYLAVAQPHDHIYDQPSLVIGSDEKGVAVLRHADHSAKAATLVPLDEVIAHVLKSAPCGTPPAEWTAAVPPDNVAGPPA